VTSDIADWTSDAVRADTGVVYSPSIPMPYTLGYWASELARAL
jgi:hypothetical protein